MKSPKYIHFVSQYATPYKGNFIASLEVMEKALDGYSVVYTFPKSAECQPWMPEFWQEHTVRFTDDDVSSFLAVQQLEGIFTEFPPTLIHTHFDGYDVSVVRATKSFVCNIVWHMHNWLSFMPNIIKRAYQYWCIFKHYGLSGKKNVFLISVCEEMRKFACKFGFSSKRTITVPNGIDISRFKLPAPRPTSRDPFVFLAFGGRNTDKRIDLICEASKYINTDTPYEIWITEGVDTKDIVRIYKDNQKIKIIPQSENVGILYSMAHCFISSSVHETFSYAIAEASLYGNAIIQSDISGTAWNQNGPATWVFPTEDVQALADCMQKVMNEDEIKLTERCQAASDFILHNYSLHAWQDKILQFYKDKKLI